MTDAPAVSYRVGRTPALGFSLAALWAAGALVVAVLLAQPHMRWSLASVLLPLVLLLAGGGLLRFWRRQQVCRLVWDGACWGLQDGRGVDPFDDGIRVEIRLDLQRAVLLLLRDPRRQRPLWLWAQASEREMRHWHLLRCALYSSSKSAVRSGADAMIEHA